MFDLSFEIVARFRPFEIVAPGFVSAEADSVPGPGLRLADQGPPAPYAAVELRPDAARGSVSAGLATPDGDHVLVRWSAESSRVSLEIRVDGRTRVLRRRKVTVHGPFGLAFVLCENQVTALLDRGAGWEPVLTERSKVAARVDLRREETLARYRYAWSRSAVHVGAARAGIFGMTGLRDPHLVQHTDGEPYERDGRWFMTWTCAGLGFFQQAHWSVWSFDPAAPAEMRLESQIFSRRDGLVLGDHAGQLVREGDHWLVATSAWGDFEPGSVHVRHATSTADLLTGVHVLDTERTALPTPHGSWDPALARVDGTWHVGFVESPSQKPFDFHPALASTEAERWHDGLGLVAAATHLHRAEGPVLVRVDRTTWLLASDGQERSFPVFDLTGRRRGRVDAPYPTNIPHPQLVPAPGGGWWLVTFNGAQRGGKLMGYGGHGHVVVMRSA